jgi:hypothetical protein
MFRGRPDATEDDSLSPGKKESQMLNVILDALVGWFFRFRGPMSTFRPRGK